MLEIKSLIRMAAIEELGCLGGFCASWAERTAGARGEQSELQTAVFATFMIFAPGKPMWWCG
jgi:hypothetical protein